MQQITIYGGGISGLAAAYYARIRWQDAEITLYEKEERLGGVIDAIESPYFFEKGPRTFRKSGAGELLEIISDLGLKTVDASPAAKRRYIISGGELTPLPASPLELFTTKLGRVALGGLIRDYYKKPVLCDETIGDFSRRRFGNKMTEFFIDPMVKGIFAGDLDKLSVSACFPFLKAWEKKYGSIVKGASQNRKGGGLFSIAGGIGKLTEALANSCDIRLSHSIGSIEKKGDLTICALPLATLQEIDSPHRELFSQLNTESLTVCNFAYSPSVNLPSGFGYLIPRSENENVLGVVFDSEIFPHESRDGEKRLTVMLRTDSDAICCAREALSRHLGIYDEPLFSSVTNYPNIIPQYRLGHEATIAPLLADRNILWTGNYLTGVSVNACIKRSKQVIEDC